MQRPERERKEPTEFNVIVKAKDLVKHTFTITNSTERYPKKYRFTLVNRIQDKAVDIYECVLEANELDLRDAQEYRQRQKLQAKALTYCKELLFFIELSQEMGFISMSSCEYWSKLALEVKYMTTAWKKRDKAESRIPPSKEGVSRRRYPRRGQIQDRRYRSIPPSGGWQRL